MLSRLSNSFDMPRTSTLFPSPGLSRSTSQYTQLKLQPWSGFKLTPMDKPRARCEITAYTYRLLSELRGRPNAVSRPRPPGIPGHGALLAALPVAPGRLRVLAL